MIDLERDLVDLGDHLAAPTGDDVEARVRAVITAGPRRARWGRWIAAALAAVGLTIAAFTAAPTVADWLGVGGVEVRQEPSPVTPRIGVPLGLGRLVTLQEAARIVDYELVIPARLGPPDEVWVDNSSGTELVSFLYRATAELPAAPGTGVGALFMQADIGVADQLLATKFAEPGTRIEPVELGIGKALWIEGTHFVAFNDRRGNVVAERARVANNVLLWERGRITIRIETSRGRDEAIAIARSAE